MKSNQVRPVAVCIFKKSGRIFVAEGYNPAKQETFYRPLGGSIEFGERGQEALARELREEISAEAINLKYLGTIENIFTFNEEPGHEIVLVYEGDFADKAMYEKTLVTGYGDDGDLFSAGWKPLSEFGDNSPLYPEGLMDLLLKSGYSFKRDTRKL